MTHKFEKTKEWLTAVLRPYVLEAIEVVKSEHLLSRAPQNSQRGTTPMEDGEVSEADRARSPTLADVGSIVDPGTLSYFNQYCQQNHVKVEWKTSDAKGTKATPLWRVVAIVNDKPVGEGMSTGKKGAKILAAKAAMKELGIAIGKSTRRHADCPPNLISSFAE